MTVFLPKATKELRAERLGDKVIGADKDLGTSDWGIQLNPNFRARSAGHDGGPVVTETSPEAERILSLWYPNTPTPKRRK